MIFGFINRQHICKKFGVSVPQASIDLRQVMKGNPHLMIYNSSSKCYEWVDGE